MCYNFNNKGVNLKKALEAFKAESLDQKFDFIGSINAFIKQDKPTIPTIVNKDGIVLMNTFWSAQEHPDSPTKGKNLQSEKSHTYYKKIENNRCLIPASSYYEYKHYAVVGKKTPLKIKHEMFWKNKEQFYIAGFYQIYSDGNLGFGLVTTVANELMSSVHNSKLRMPICMDAKTADRFLNDEPIEDFTFPQYDPQLVAVNLEPDKLPPSLF